MFHVILFEPEIPPNTGNIIRLCANTGARLHLIHPLGFTLDEKALRRAGLDYHQGTDILEYTNWQDFIKQHGNKRIFALSTKAGKVYSEVPFQDEDMFLFGPESRGLHLDLLTTHHALTIPMRPNNRSLNLANSVAIVVYEAWRQLNFRSI
ncbi:MAG: tRNA (cytidine(34)-2'-O)-methyltransferase [Legionella sp.]|nr:tRNA (cytidine(34)-2'-O)-methyltransferase [Legionella sp.]